jgi:hypothetical protein
MTALRADNVARVWLWWRDAGGQDGNLESAMMIRCIDDPVVLNRKIRGGVTDAHLIDDSMLDVIGAVTKFQSAWTKLMVQMMHAEIRVSRRSLV